MDFRVEQAAAMEALVRSLDSKSAADVVALLLKDVSLRGESVVGSVGAICESAASPPRGTGAPSGFSAIELVALVVQAIQKESQVKVGDIVGQILWRHRKTEALQERRFKKIAENIEWAVADQLNDSPKLIEAVDGVFRKMTAADGGRMSTVVWRKVAKIIQANPVLNSRLRRTDADRLYYAETHNRGEANSGGITRREFKSLLVQLAFCMGVPPYMVLLAVGAHNECAAVKAEESVKAEELDEEPAFMCKTASFKARNADP